VECRFEKTTVQGALPQTGFDPTVPAFFSMLGVSQYLTEGALDETLEMVRATDGTIE
jgi:O-methyltransferase involved in polyketide biosynthesis